MIIELKIKTWFGIEKGRYSISVNESKADDVFEKITRILNKFRSKNETDYNSEMSFE